MDKNVSDCRLYSVGFIDFNGKGEKLESLELLSTEVPRFPVVFKEFQSSSTSEDWNEAYQSCFEAACKSSNEVIPPGPIDSTNSPIVSPLSVDSKLTIAQLKAMTQPSNAVTRRKPGSAYAASAISDMDMESVFDENKRDARPEENDPQLSKREKEAQQLLQQEHRDMDNIKSGLELASFCGEFFDKAVKGSRIIVDEYSLPDELKTVARIPLLQLGEHDFDSELFNFDGLLFRVAGRPAEESDQHSNDADNIQKDIASDIHVEKIVGADYRGGVAVQAARADLEIDKYLHRKQLSHVGITLPMQKRNDFTANLSGRGQSEQQQHVDESSESVLPSNLLSTIVDYAGFRISVICPIMDMKRNTLIYGYSPKHSVFVDSFNQVNGTLNVIVKKLNLSFTTTYQTMTKKVLWYDDEASDPTTAENRHSESVAPLSRKFARGLANAVTVDLEAHLCADGKSYLVNFQSLFPPDLPRTNSLDVQIRHLRPEYVKRWHTPLSPLTLGRGYGEFGLNIREELSERKQSALDSVHSEIRNNEGKLGDAIVHLYSVHLPAVAASLDSAEFIPLDSYSLSNYLHARGVNIRSLGVLFELCKASWSRRLLLSEAVARCCKVLHSRLLRSASRKGKAVSISAQFRGRSHAKDYYEQLECLLNERQRISVSFFNVVFGHGSNTTLFWSGGALAELLMTKYGIDLSKIVKTSMIHLPQLFLAVQYHTGVEFVDSPDFMFEHHDISEPLTLLDLVHSTSTVVSRQEGDEGDMQDFALPQSETPRIRVDVKFPGLVGSTDRLAESLLVSSLFDEAANVFRLRLSLLHLMHPNELLLTPSCKAKIAYCVYHLALCYYLSGKFVAAGNEIRTFLNSRLSGGRGGICRLFSGVSGGMMSLLCAIEFKIGNMTDALKYYDSACMVYEYCLGGGVDKSGLQGMEVGHPVQAFHMCSLADLYHSIPGGHASARIMMTLAHEMSRRSLGPTHRISNSFAKKLGVLCLEEKAYPEAYALLAGVTQILEALYEKCFRCDDLFDQRDAVCSEYCECLYFQAVAAMKKHEYPNSIEISLQLLQVSKKLSTSTMIPSEVVAGMVLLSELYSRQRETFGKSVDYLQMALSTIKSGRVKHINAGGACASLVCKILDLIVASQSLQARNLLETVVSETLNRHPMNVDPDLVLEPVKLDWRESCKLLFSKLWSDSPKDIYDQVFHKLLAKESFAVGTSSVSARNEDESASPEMELSLLVKLTEIFHQH